MHAMKMFSTSGSGATAPSDLRQVKYGGGRVQSRIAATAFMAGLVVLFSAAGHSEPLTDHSRQGRLTGSLLPEHGQRVSAAMDHNDSRQYHVLDKDLQRLYDEIMARGGASRPR